MTAVVSVGVIAAAALLLLMWNALRHNIAAPAPTP